MEYLKKYGIKDSELEKLKNKYSEEIIKFIEENEIFVENTINYLYSENIKGIYWLMINNIKIFLETQIALQERIEEMKKQGLNAKEIQLTLLQE